MSFEKVKPGVVKRTEKRVFGLFIDGTGLDRATRRINRKVDLAGLVRGLTSGIAPVVARYYTLVPFEDDSRQHAFLDAVARAGLTVVVKRLPPKGITRQVSVDVEMGADIVAFALGQSKLSELSLYRPYEDFDDSNPENRVMSMMRRGIIASPQKAEKPKANDSAADVDAEANNAAGQPIESSGEKTKALNSVKRVVTVVCPGRDLAYPIGLARELGADTVNADFAQFNQGDVLKSAAKWIDLSDSEMIWKD